MATLFMLCGLPGSGKTSLARRLEAHGALALSLDDWMVARGTDDELSEEIAQEQWQTAAAACSFTLAPRRAFLRDLAHHVAGLRPVLRSQQTDRPPDRWAALCFGLRQGS
jgi:broad-specificity NMP kinase